MPQSYGLYFSWGNLDGHPAGAGYNFNQINYDGTPAASISADLSLSEDAARAILGAPWRMPTSEEFIELYDNCVSEFTTLNGVNGLLFTSNINGNTLFLPAAGNYIETTLGGRGSSGNYWSATYSSVQSARDLVFNSSEIKPDGFSSRRFGFTVRPVQDGEPNRSVVPPTPEE